ncbi:hypothetical protein [Burkholderia sp. BCC1640]|uniref:hypothetical protein n=1 Tax=Burkholderia sp. BCC1640 TaxID=2676294 RepID=UPI00158BC493|nr:hypothetical protein [Burkholderia sp. BCC1640]
MNSTPVQSLQHQDAGQIFDVQPTVMADVIQFELQEQMSSFVATTTGVNNSPTKNTRQMQTTVSMKDSEVIGAGRKTRIATTVPAGCRASSGDRSLSQGRRELLLVLQVLRI